MQVPVILVGNKIDLRGGHVTNQGLEDEIAPLMRDFKVGGSLYRMGIDSAGSRDCRRVLGPPTPQRLGSLLLCPESRLASYCSPLRFARACKTSPQSTADFRSSSLAALKPFDESSKSQTWTRMVS